MEADFFNSEFGDEFVNNVWINCMFQKVISIALHWFLHFLV